LQRNSFPNLIAVSVFKDYNIFSDRLKIAEDLEDCKEVIF